MLLFWPSARLVAAPAPVGTITLGGGGYPSRYWRRWEAVAMRQEIPEPEAPEVIVAARKLIERIGKPKPITPVEVTFPAMPPAVEPAPPPAIAKAIEEIIVAPPPKRRPRKTHRYWRPGVGQMATGKQPVVLVTRYWGGLGLAMLMQRQGADVYCAYDYTSVPEKELEATETCGTGLVRKLSLQEAMRKLIGQGTLWAFDGNDLPKEADALREQGELVIGTTQLSQRLEDDRDFAAATAESIGLDLPETEHFTNYDQAIAYLEAQKDRAFVYKPDKQDPTATYVPLEHDPAKGNEELREYLHSLPQTAKASFILQEQVHGIEANFDLWLRDGQPVAAFLDIESKRKLVGDLGENVGCAGGYVLSLPLDSPGVRATVGKYLQWPALHHYTGSVDANVMIVDGHPLFLENCFRFGYNAYPTIFQALAQRPMEDILRDWVAGTGTLDGAFRSDFGSSLTLVCDHPDIGTPVLIPQEAHEAVYLYRAFVDEDHVAMVDHWAEIACVLSSASTLEAAGQNCLQLAQRVAFPGKGYRVDLALDSLPTLPIARYQALQEMGWLGDQPVDDDEDTMATLLGVLE